MKAEKFLKSGVYEEGGITYVNRLSEVRHIGNITREDFDFIYQTFFMEDEERASTYNFVIYEEEYYSLSCDDMIKVIGEWLNDVESNNEKLEDYKDEFIGRFEKLRNIFEDNIGFTIFFDWRKEK